MRNDQPKETWQTIGDLARALAAKLRATREEKDESGGRHLDVPPGGTATNVPDSSGPKAKDSRDRLMVSAVGPDKPDNISGYQGSWTTLPATDISSPPLLVTVSTVVGSRPEEKMIGVDATGNVAFVQDAFACWDGAECYNPSCAMRQPRLAVQFKGTMPKFVAQGAEPQIASAIGFRHAAFFENMGDGGAHSALSLVGNSGATAGESRRPAQGPKARATVAIGGTSPAGSDDYASPGNIATGNNLEFATLVAPGRTATGPSLVMAPQGPVADHQHTPPASAICAAS